MTSWKQCLIWNSSFSAEVDYCFIMVNLSDSAGLTSEYGIRQNISYQEINPADHIVPGGTDKSNGGDYENRLQHVKFGGLAILKP